MPTFHDPVDFLALHDHGRGLPLLDVRSPGEFAAGHIPGAINFPLLNDEERALVGTAHARGGREAAVHLALEHLGPQLAGKLSRARTLLTRTGKGRELLMHCWRGGMRSGAMAWLLELGGYAVHLLKGGYKAYRTWIREDFARPARLLALGGLTGCGKSEILAELAALGAQVIDLEGLAGHRGSAFGGIGLPAQPSNESVENHLHAVWSSLDFSRPVWVEDENRQIGTVTLPEAFFARLAAARLVLVEIPLEARVERLARIYAGEDCIEALSDALGRIRKRLGDEKCRRCLTAVREGRPAEAVRLVLSYYDKAYTYLLEHGERPVALQLSPERDDPAQTARRLAAQEEELAGTLR